MFKRLEDVPVTAAANNDEKTPAPDGEPAPDAQESECICVCSKDNQASNFASVYAKPSG